MIPEIPDWFKEVSIFVWLTIASLAMVIFSMIYGQRGDINLWLISYLFGLWGFTLDKLGKDSLFRKIAIIILLSFYTLLVILEIMV